MLQECELGLKLGPPARGSLPSLANQFLSTAPFGDRWRIEMCRHKTRHCLMADGPFQIFQSSLFRGNLLSFKYPHRIILWIYPKAGVTVSASSFRIPSKVASYQYPIIKTWKDYKRKSIAGGKIVANDSACETRLKSSSLFLDRKLARNSLRTAASFPLRRLRHRLLFGLFLASMIFSGSSSHDTPRLAKPFRLKSAHFLGLGAWWARV